MPMMSPAAQTGAVSPFDDPTADETLVLLSSGGVSSAYAVSNQLEVRTITPAQLLAAAECRPDTPGRPLPANTNERVMAAFEMFKGEVRGRLGRARRPGADSRVRRYLSRQLNMAREQFADDQEELSRIQVLRRIFLDSLPTRVVEALQDIRDVQLEGEALIRRLEALRARYRLNPPEEDEAEDLEPQVIRIVCSDGLTR
jgi:hypothetical protein